jgi:WD40 repeat protein/energy-coupling factor transporter ATP-binding protein EcfA2
VSRDALVVGISSYQFLPVLGAPSRDAEAIAQRLQTDGEFRVTRMPEVVQAGKSKVGVKTPVTLAELEAALVQLFKPRGKNVPQTALFYFSGHGLQKDAGIQEGYLATSDTNPSAGAYGLSLFWLRRLLQQSPVRQRIVLLDCCHSGELLNFLEADPGAQSGTDRLFMAAAREYEAAYESIAGNYSVFTQALLDGLNPERLPQGSVTNYALTDWVSNALKGEMQQPMFENSGSEILLTRCHGSPTLIKTELKQDVCPYRGLEYFDEIHASYFFGREDLTDQLIERVRSRNFVAVVGASGSGKSSLIRAGLIHKLRQGQKFSGSDQWRIQLITPTEQPLKSLAAAFVNPNHPAIERAEQLRRAETFLREGGTGLAQLVRASVMSTEPGQNSHLLLIIDQFEEVFTLCQGIQAERDRHLFFNCLLSGLKEVSDCFHLVIVLRADFFGKCSLYNGLAEQIERNLITVTPLTYEQIKASVVKPAEKVGLVCEPNLVYNILLDIVGAPGELPLLQYTLLELWQRRQPDPAGGPDRLTLNAYTELGGVRGTLRKRADEIFYSLTPEEQRIAKRIFIALTQLGEGTEDTRRRTLKSELVSSRYPAEVVERVLEKLVAAKLIVTNRIVTTSRSPEHRAQGLASVSTVLRLAQKCQKKLPSGEQVTQLLSDRSPPTHLQQKDTNTWSALVAMPQLPDLHPLAMASPAYQETVDVAHETLIRNWSLLQTWLEENREVLRRQRRIENVAREWDNAQQTRAPEYLLHGDRLVEAEMHLAAYSDDLSELAQRYITISREEVRRTQRELRLLQLAVPFTLLVALVVTFNQYRAAVQSQSEKDFQVQVATSRQRAAISQAILQEPNGDPTTALLISRLAVEAGGLTNEAQASLRAALQKLRLQANLPTGSGTAQQLAFSSNQRHLATAGADGVVRLWSLNTKTVVQVLKWEAPKPRSNAQSQAAAITTIAFSPDAQFLAAIAKDSTQVVVWSTASGAVRFRLGGFQKAVTHFAFSTKGDWIAAASADKTVRIWHGTTGAQQRVLTLPASINQLRFSPDGKLLLIATGNTVQLVHNATGKIHKLLVHPQVVKTADFSPTRSEVATGCTDGKVRLWQVQTQQLPVILAQNPENRTNRQPLSVSRVQFSPDGQTLVATDAHNQIWLWDAQTEQLRVQLTQPYGTDAKPADRQPAIAFSPDSRRLITSHRNLSRPGLAQEIQIWDVQTGKSIDGFRAHPDAVEAVLFSPDGSLIATAGTEGAVRLWAAEIGSEFPTLKLEGEVARSLIFRSSGTQVNPRTTPTIPLPPQGSTRSLQSVANRTESIEEITGSPQPGINEIVVVTRDGVIQRLNMLPAGDVAGAVPQPTPLTTKRMKKAQNWFGQVSETLTTWKVNFPWQQGEAVSATNQSEPSPDQIAEASSAIEAPNSADAQLSRTTATTLRLSEKLPPGLVLTDVTLSADSQLIAAADSSGSVELWQLKPDFSPQRVRRLSESAVPARLERSSQPQPGSINSPIRNLAFSPDRQKLLGVGEDQVVRVWDVTSGKLVSRLEGHEASVEQAQFSPDGQFIATASRDHTTRIWQVASGQALTVLHQQSTITSIGFSPNGQLIVTTSQDGIARVLEATSGTLRVVLAGHRGAIWHAQFSPDGQMLVTASEDGTARLWDAQTGTERTILRSAEATAAEPLQRAFFSPDGRYVATVTKSGRLHLWAATWEGLLALARDRSLRQLQPEECLRYLGLTPNACPILPD